MMMMMMIMSRTTMQSPKYPPLPRSCYNIRPGLYGSLLRSERPDPHRGRDQLRDGLPRRGGDVPRHLWDHPHDGAHALCRHVHRGWPSDLHRLVGHLRHLHALFETFP